MKFRFRHMAILHVMAAVVLAAVACSRASREPEDHGEEGTVTLNMRITMRAGGSGDNTAELMHTLRIIILDGAGFAEHNAYWNFDNAIEDYTTSSFKVKANDTKTILMVANEESAVLTLPDGSKVSAHDWLTGIDAAAGEYVDMETARGITMTLADNFAADGSMSNGSHYIPMSAVHTYTVGNNRNYSGTFYIHRAAAKYTFRFTVNDDKNDHTVNSVSISSVASTEYFFPNATFSVGTDIPQARLLSYVTPADLTSSNRTFAVTDGKIPAGTKDYVEFGPYYVPEGRVSPAGGYGISFKVDGTQFPWLPLEPHEIDGATVTNPKDMTDLPRNTHIIVNVTLNPMDFSVSYTICKWEEHEVVIPGFN